MSRLRRIVTVVLVGAALTSLSACDFDVEGIMDELENQSFADSKDPEVVKVGEARVRANKVKAAGKARDRYLKSGEYKDLLEADRLNPDDPELKAYRLMDGILARDHDDFRDNQANLYQAIAEKRRKEKLPTDLKSVTHDYNLAVLEAEGKMLAKSSAGGRISDPGEADKRGHELFDSYCNTLKRHNKDFPYDPSLLSHHDTFGQPCP